MSTNKVFISHQQADTKQASRWATFFKKFGIDYYLDVQDPETYKLKGPSIARYLRNQLTDCSHLLVIYSSATKTSEWVPFEIGLAVQADKGMATDASQPAINNLPEYLLEWPILRSDKNMLDFINEVQQSQTVIKSLPTNQFYTDRFTSNLRERMQRHN